MSQTTVTEEQLLEQMVSTANELQTAQTTVLQVKADVETKATVIESSNAAAPLPVWDGTQLKFVKGNDSTVDLSSYVDLKGDKGDKGETGDTGAPGATGPQGEKGDTGAQGEKGDKGDKGDTGATGPQGPKGDTGDTGPQGLKGDTGETGPQGPKGDTGDTGPQGPQGIQGEKGDKGDTGAAGTNATLVLSTDSSTGVVTMTATDVNGVTTANISQGAQGPQGEKGDKGDTGATGPQGPQGEKGDTGATGPQGAKGDKGDTGATGPQGAKGDTGATPTLEVGTVSTGDADVAISLKSGSTTAYVVDFTLPGGTGGGATVVAAPTITGGDNIAIGYATEISLSSSSFLNGVSIDHFEVTFNGTTKTVTASSNAGTVSLTMPSGTAANSKKTISVVAYDTLGNASAATEKTATAVAACIDTPTISSPTSGASVLSTSALTVALSAFHSTGYSDTQKNITVTIYSDSACTTVAKTKTAASGNSVTFTASEVAALGTGKFYIKGSYTGTELGTSSMSAAVNVFVAVPTTTASGRTIYRHSSDKGCVIEFDHFGTTKKVFWADAAYRTKAKFGTYGTDSSNPNISGSSFYATSTGSSIGAKDAIGTVTDATLKTKNTNFQNDLSMRTLCDTWMTYEGQTDSQNITGVPAVRHCRNTLTDVFTGGCDLPDIYTLCVAFIEGKTIDALDPTAAANPTKAMSEDINTSGHGYMDGASYCWSSSECASVDCWRVHSNGLVYGDGKNNEYGVCPAREI